MIQQANLSVESQRQKEWQKDLKQSFTRLSDLLAYLNLAPELKEGNDDARQLFSMRVPRPFANLMEQGNPNDPLLLQVMPQQREFVQTLGYVADPLEEHQAELPGLLHKYKSRVLIMFKTGCAVNCRYCFRRHFPYEENAVNKQQLKQHLEYIAAHPEINEVILSGGDPLMAKDEHLQWFVDELEAINHVTRLRIHSRLPVVIPSRITPELCELLQNTRLNTVMVYHINHHREISDELTTATHQLKQSGVTVLNQAVLLSGINDQLELQVALHEESFNAGILPYYLHVFDKVQGAAHFDLADEKVKALYQEMLKALPGFLVPKLVREIGGEASKTPIHPF